LPAAPFAERVDRAHPSIRPETQENQGTLPDRCDGRRELRPDPGRPHGGWRCDQPLKQPVAWTKGAGIPFRSEGRSAQTIEGNRDSRNVEMARRTLGGVESRDDPLPVTPYRPM